MILSLAGDKGNLGGGREEVENLKTGNAHTFQHRMLFLQRRAEQIS